MSHRLVTNKNQLALVHRPTMYMLKRLQNEIGDPEYIEKILRGEAVAAPTDSQEYHCEIHLRDWRNLWIKKENNQLTIDQHMLLSRAIPERRLFIEDDDDVHAPEVLTITRDVRVEVPVEVQVLRDRLLIPDYYLEYDEFINRALANDLLLVSNHLTPGANVHMDIFEQPCSVHGFRTIKLFEDLEISPEVIAAPFKLLFAHPENGSIVFKISWYSLLMLTKDFYSAAGTNDGVARIYRCAGTTTTTIPETAVDGIRRIRMLPHYLTSSLATSRKLEELIQPDIDYYNRYMADTINLDAYGVLSAGALRHTREMHETNDMATRHGLIDAELYTDDCGEEVWLFSARPYDLVTELLKDARDGVSDLELYESANENTNTSLSMDDAWESFRDYLFPYVQELHDTLSGTACSTEDMCYNFFSNGRFLVNTSEVAYLARFRRIVEGCAPFQYWIMDDDHTYVVTVRLNTMLEFWESLHVPTRITEEQAEAKLTALLTADVTRVHASLPSGAYFLASDGNSVANAVEDLRTDGYVMVYFPVEYTLFDICDGTALLHFRYLGETSRAGEVHGMLTIRPISTVQRCLE